MNDLYQQIIDRNALETDPFVSILESNATLLNQVDALQNACELAKQEISILRQQLQDAANNDSSSSSGVARFVSNAAAQAALRNETRLREKLESLQEELNNKLKLLADRQSEALEKSDEISSLKDKCTEYENDIKSLKEEKNAAEKTIETMKKEVEDAKSNARLAEQQYDGLKNTIRNLQEENDKFQKENRELETRLITDKEKMISEMNRMTEMIEGLKRQNDMLKSLKGTDDNTGNLKELAKQRQPNHQNGNQRKFGNFGVVIPSSVKTMIPAHSMEGTCIRYDPTGRDICVTSSSDSTVKVWDTNTGALRATMRGSHGHSFIGCDVMGDTVAGAGSDKTCRIWNLKTQRMIHHLVGHQHKITCVRLYNNEHSVITGSADRSLKVWDIARRTYKQTITLRHSSTSNCLDVAPDSESAVSGHMDGGLRFWDLRSGERVIDIPGIHESGICSVQFDPNSSNHVLTNSLDSSLKLIDIRNCSAVQTFRHVEFSSSHGWSKGVLSPDGRYVLAGSGMNGQIFVWDTNDGSLKKKLQGHQNGVVAVDWSRGGSSGQQVATLDRKGAMILWA